MEKLAELPAPMRNSLITAGLIHPGDPLDATPLAGGVSSDIWRVVTRSGPVCIKRALSRLRVDQLWEAPVERNRFEAEWLSQAMRIIPEAVPDLIAHDATNGIVVMTYFPAETYANWKAQLRDGEVSINTIAKVANALGRIHAASAARPALRQMFDNQDIFEAVRIEPYLRATALKHADRASQINALIASLQTHQIALIHGDFSPKNILVGPDNIIILDAECAAWGDPCFDVAFCLNHFLLKSIWNRAAAARLHAGLAAFWSAYLTHVDWEAGAELERRVAHLLPALLLARIDGKSPVEYITREPEKAFVRKVARAGLIAPHDSVSAVSAHWFDALATQTTQESQA